MNRLYFKIFKHSYEYIRQWNEIIIIDMIYSNALASNKILLRQGMKYPQASNEISPGKQ